MRIHWFSASRVGTVTRWEIQLSIERIVSEIDAEIGRLEEATRLLSGGEAARRGPGRPPKDLTATVAPKKRRAFSAAARAKMAAAQKARWAKVRKSAKSPAVTKSDAAK